LATTLAKAVDHRGTQPAGVLSHDHPNRMAVELLHTLFAAVAAVVVHHEDLELQIGSAHGGRDGRDQVREVGRLLVSGYHDTHEAVGTGIHVTSCPRGRPSTHRPRCLVSYPARSRESFTKAGRVVVGSDGRARAGAGGRAR